MRQITREGKTWGGTYTIYEGREDAIAHGIRPENILHWKDYSVKIGNWVEYPDGSVTEVVRVYGPRTRKEKKTKSRHGGLSVYKANHITTRLNCYSQTQSTVLSTCLPYSASTIYTQPETVSIARVKFAEDWLLGGLEIGESCKKHLWRARLGTRNAMPARTYGYMVLTLPWFDKLLKANRLIRDRYMTLVGALGTVGIDEAYVAEKLKEGMESLNVKEKINALNKVIDLLEISAAKKHLPIQASWQIESPLSPKQLSESPANINSLLEETLHERKSSTISETQRVETVPFINQVEVNGSPISQTNRDTSVSPETTNEERIQYIK